MLRIGLVLFSGLISSHFAAIGHFGNSLNKQAPRADLFSFVVDPNTVRDRAGAKCITKGRHARLVGCAVFVSANKLDLEPTGIIVSAGSGGLVENAATNRFCRSLLVGENNVPLLPNALALLSDPETQSTVPESVTFEPNYFGFDNNVASGCLTLIGEIRVRRDLQFFVFNCNSSIGECSASSHPSPSLESEGICCDLIGDASSVQLSNANSESFDYKPDTNGCDNDTCDSRTERRSRPQSHALLGAQIAFGCLSFVCGFYYLLYAFREGHRLTILAGAIYASAGALGILCGCIFGLLVITGI